MGVLGISLLFVGIVLVMNGVNHLLAIDSKSIATMNLITASVLLTLNLVSLTQAEGIYDYQNVASGLLFGFTYVFIAVNHLLKLDLRPFGWFSLFVTIYAVVMAINSYTFDVRMTLLWGAWAILWLDGFVELGLGVNLGKKTFPYLSITVGIFAAFIPAMFMLLNLW